MNQNSTPAPVNDTDYTGAAACVAFRERHAFTQNQAAAALGISPRAWRYLESGSLPTRRHYLLAMAAINHALDPFDPEPPAATLGNTRSIGTSV